MDLSRRKTLQAIVGTTAVAGVGGISSKVSAASFTSASSPTSKTLHEVVHSARGPVAVGGGGKILHRSPNGWHIVVDSGIQTSGSTLYDAAISSDGRVVWVCGSSGVVGAYDVFTGEVTDYSQPTGISNTWQAVSAHGSRYNERVHLVNGSGQLLRGDRDNNASVSWKSVQKPTGGNAINGHANLGHYKSRIVGSGGEIYESEDYGQSWSKIGVSNLGKTLNDLSNTRSGGLSAVGYGGTIVDYDDKSWNTVSVDGTVIHTVSRNGKAGIAAGKEGSVYVRSSGSWSEIDIGSTAILWGSSLPQRSGAPDIIVGSGGSILERGSYEAPMSSITLQNTSTNDLEYEFEVAGELSETLQTGTNDSVEATSSTNDRYIASGALTGTGTEKQDRYDFAGDLGNLDIISGSIRDLDIQLDNQTVVPYQISGTEWIEASTPISKTIYSTSDSSVGPFSVGGGGKVLKRTGQASWDITLSNGPGSNGNALYCCATTDDGRYLWFGGASGALGVLDVETGEITDHTAPNNISNSWQDIYVNGNSGSETVHLSSSAGQLLTGTRSSGSMSWGSTQTPGSGSAIPALDFRGAEVGYFVDTNGDAFRSPDGGDTWQKFGIASNGGTPQDIDVRSDDDILVSAGSGYLLRWDGNIWNKIDLGGSTRYSVDTYQNRSLVVGGGGSVFKRGPRDWNSERSSGATLYDVNLLEGSSPVAIAVGGSGTIFEQQFSNDIY